MNYNKNISSYFIIRHTAEDEMGMPEKRLIKDMNDFVLNLSEYIGKHKFIHSNVDFAFRTIKENDTFLLKEVYGKYIHDKEYRFDEDILNFCTPGEEEKFLYFLNKAWDGKEQVFNYFGIPTGNFLVWLHPVFDNGNIVEIMGYCISISKWNEEKNLITVMDMNGIIKYATKSHEHHTGYSIDKLIETNVFDLQHPEDLDMVLNTAKIVVTNKTSQILSYRVKCKDSSWVRLLSIAFPLVIDNGDVIGQIVISEVLSKVTPEL